ncbi:MAG: phage tail protein [Solirubrobacteraceae bacterium]
MSTNGRTPPVSTQVVVAAPPPSASARAYLRGGLPSVYLEGDFGMHFIGALEFVLDPVVDILDSLPAYLSADLGPDGLLRLMATWLGLITDEDLPLDVRRALVRNAAEVNRRRGTSAGIELILRLTFPDLSLSVRDSGGVRVSDGVPDVSGVGDSQLIVRSAAPLTPDQREAILRVLERERPVHVRCSVEEPAAGAARSSMGGARA